LTTPAVVAGVLIHRPQSSVLFAENTEINRPLTIHRANLAG
jgi:hypothetical protein